MPEFAIDAENAGDVARICFRLDGLPLALELAAARLGALGTATLAERLDDRFRLLRTRQSRRADAPADARGDAAVEPRAAGGRGEAAAAPPVGVRRRLRSAPPPSASAPATGWRSGAVADVLARLVEKSLVSVESTGRELRYRLLETVRLYARELLQAAGESAALAERHASWALAMVEREGDSPRLDREEANLRVAHDALLARDPREALALLRRADAVLAAPHRPRGGAPALRRERSRAAPQRTRCSARRRCSRLGDRPARGRPGVRHRARAGEL